MGEVRKVLITGAAGYIGKHLCYHLKKGLFAPHITAIDKNETGIKRLVSDGMVDCWYRVDDVLRQGSDFGHYDWVFHLAATSSVPAFDWDPITGVKNTIEACELLEHMTFDKLFHTSSASILKDNSLDDNWYIMSKRMAENILTKRYGKKVWNMRLHNVAGCIVESGYVEDHDPETHLIPNVVRKNVIEVYGDGSHRRDYIHVEDVCKALSSAALQFKPHEYAGRNDLYEIGTGRSYSVIDVIRTYQEMTGAGMGIQFCPGRSEPEDQRAIQHPFWLDFGGEPYKPIPLRTIISDTIKGYENASSKEKTSF